eukprot:1319281-Rhodomonas_salina.1
MRPRRSERKRGMAVAKPLVRFDRMTYKPDPCRAIGGVWYPLTGDEYNWRYSTVTLRAISLSLSPSPSCPPPPPPLFSPAAES